MEDVKQVTTLNSFLDWWFVSFRSLHDLSGVGVGGDHCLAAALVVHVHQLGQVESGSLQNLHFTDADIMEGVDSLACLLNISGNRIWDKFVDNFFQVSATNFSLDDVSHLLPDVLDLGALGVASLLLAVLLLQGESDAEDTEHVSVTGLDVNVALDQSLPLLDHGPQLVGGQVHAVEGGQAVLSLDVLNNQLELSVRSLSVILILEISKGNLKNSSLQTLGGNLGSSSSVNQSLANLTDLEDSWSLDVIPVLSCEWINDLLLDTLLASNLEALVFAYSHV